MDLQVATWVIFTAGSFLEFCCLLVSDAALIASKISVSSIQPVVNNKMKMIIKESAAFMSLYRPF